MPAPNIIFILCDQLRGDAVGFDGNTVVQTPHLDALAADGTRFSHAYTAVPSCIPARSTLWSGQSQWHTGVLGMGRGQGPIPNDFSHTLAGELSDAGYRTHMVGKGHFEPARASMGFQSAELDEASRMPDADYRLWFAEHAPEGVTPNDHGVGANDWRAEPWHTDEELHQIAWTMSRSLAFLESDHGEQPFFLNISFVHPHSPYVPPQRYFDRYADAELPAPQLGEWSAMHDDPETARKPAAWRGVMSDEQIRHSRAGYYGSVSFIDDQVGRLMDWMKQRCPETLANTWFLFASDHGDMLGDHNLWRKTYAYEGSARIPFLVVPPSGQDRPGRSCADEVVELRDVMPTLLEAAGVPVPGTVDGRSVLPLLNAAGADWRDYIHGEHCSCYSEDQEMQYVTDGRRKFIWLPRIGVEQFFDLEADPGETRDLRQDPDSAAEVLLWRTRLIEELSERDCGWVKDGDLHCPEEPLVSPYRTTRWSGAES